MPGGQSFIPVPNFTKKIRQNVGSGFLTTLILEDAKITLLKHSPILGLHDMDQNYRWKSARIRSRAQLGPESTGH